MWLTTIGGHEIRILARQSRRRRSVTTDCGTSRSTTIAAAERLPAARAATGARSALAGSAPNTRSSSAPASPASMSPTMRDLQLVAREHVAHIGLEIVGGDRGNDLERAVRPAGRRDGRETRLPTSAGWRCSFGLVVSRRRPRQHLAAHALDVVGVEARRGQRQPQQVERLRRGARSASAASRGNSRGRRVKPQLDRLAFQPFVEGAWRRVRRRLRRAATATMLATPGLSAGILAGAAAEREVHRDQRHRRARAPARPRCRRG